MFSRYSVKKPLTVVLAALMVVLLGVISFTKMRTDLLPEMDLPYVAVVTVYAGASPEKVETGVTKPLESALSTVSGVHTVTSISQENTSMVIFEFEYGTNMDRAVIDMNNKMGTATASMDDAVGTPILMQINPRHAAGDDRQRGCGRQILQGYHPLGFRDGGPRLRAPERRGVGGGYGADRAAAQGVSQPAEKSTPSTTVFWKRWTRSSPRPRSSSGREKPPWKRHGPLLRKRAPPKPRS